MSLEARIPNILLTGMVEARVTHAMVVNHLLKIGGPFVEPLDNRTIESIYCLAILTNFFYRIYLRNQPVFQIKWFRNLLEKYNVNSAQITSLFERTILKERCTMIYTSVKLYNMTIDIYSSPLLCASLYLSA